MYNVYEFDDCQDGIDGIQEDCFFEGFEFGLTEAMLQEQSHENRAQVTDNYDHLFSTLYLLYIHVYVHVYVNYR